MRNDRKTERELRRQQLFVVVRDAMLRAGVLSSRFKFKVLSLDARGVQYLVMIDIAWIHNGEGSRLAEIEDRIEEQARIQYDVVVKGVYWRANEVIATDQSSKTPALQRTRSPSPIHTAAQLSLASSELGALSDALSPFEPPHQLSDAGQITSPSRHKANTTTVPHEDRFSRDLQPLSGTQYGTL